MLLDVGRLALIAAVIESVEGAAIVSEVAAEVSGPTVAGAPIEGIVRVAVMPVGAEVLAGHAVKAAMLARGVGLTRSQWSAPHGRTVTSSEGE
jgi:hypothetical protein